MTREVTTIAASNSENVCVLEFMTKILEPKVSISIGDFRLRKKTKIPLTFFGLRSWLWAMVK